VSPEAAAAHIARLEAGERLEVPFHANLWIDCTPMHSVLSCTDGVFTLTTTFREFWAGHGYSLPQETASTLTIDEVRGGLMYAAVDEVRTAPLRDR
jgi:hypothetical protein